MRSKHDAWQRTRSVRGPVHLLVPQAAERLTVCGLHAEVMEPTEDDATCLECLHAAEVIVHAGVPREVQVSSAHRLIAALRGHSLTPAAARAAAGVSTRQGLAQVLRAVHAMRAPTRYRVVLRSAGTPRQLRY